MWRNVFEPLESFLGLVRKFGPARRRKRRREMRRTLRRMLSLERLGAREMMTADLGGNSLAAATDLGNLEGARQISDRVARTDPNDYFRVRLATPGDLRLNLAGLSADADLELLTRGGTRLVRSARGGSNSEFIHRTLDAGEYVVRVYRYSGDTSYLLTLTATLTAPSVPDNAGNSLAQARNLGTLSGSAMFEDAVNPSDTADFYRFRVAERSRFRLNLDGLSGDADVELLDSQGRRMAGSTRGGSSAESLEQVLAAGDYFVRVYSYGGANTRYRLTLAVEPDGPADQAGNTLDQARDLGTLSGSVTMQDAVGRNDTADVYRFRLAGRSNFRLRMEGMTADADVVLLDSQGRQLAASTAGGANAEAIDRVLDSGDYFARVYPYGDANTSYRLTMAAVAAPLPPQPLPVGLDLTAMTPIPDYDGHVGADYMATAGTPVLSPVSGRVIDVRPVGGYGTMAVAIEVTLPAERTFAVESPGSSTTTNRVVLAIGHLRPSRDLVAHPDANERFRLGRGELTYGVGSYVTAGQLLGYVETHGYEGTSTGSHVHVTASDGNLPPSNIWQGRMEANDPQRFRFIRPELAWPLLR